MLKRNISRIVYMVSLLSLSLPASAEVVEVVVFKSKAGVTDEMILTAASGMKTSISSWRGFLARKLINVGNGNWIDVVHWRDLESAKAAQDKALHSDTCLLFFSLLEEEGEQVYLGEKVLSQ